MLFLIIFAVSSVIPIISSELICNKNMLMCSDGQKCIFSSQLCDYSIDCKDASDEMNFDLCKKLNSAKSSCSSSSNNFQIKCRADSYHYDYDYSYLRDKCMDIITACTLGSKCLSSTNIPICDEITGNKLKPVKTNKEDPQDMKKKNENEAKKNLFYKMIDFISDAFIETILRNFTVCPPLFTPFNGKCFSFFTPAQVEWSDANLFCESISGQLAVLDDILKFKTVLNYIKEKDIKSDFWIGGNLKIMSENSTNCTDSTNSTGKYVWLDGNSVEIGAPFWSLYVKPNTAQLDNCLNQPQSMMPTQNIGNRCIALLEANYYFFSDEDCEKRNAPLCVTHQMQENNSIL